MAPAEIQSEKNQFYRLIRQFHSETKAIIVASVSMVVAILSLLMAWIAVDSAKTAELRSEMQNERIEEMRDMIATQDAKLYAIQKRADDG